MVVGSLNALIAPTKDLPVDSIVNVGRNMKNVIRREGLQDALSSMVLMCQREKSNIQFRFRGVLETVDTQDCCGEKIMSERYETG